jgi:hypothetical protein
MSGLSLSALPLLAVLLPSAAFALAGLAEHTSVFHYNDFALIVLGHPSDICSGASNRCLALERGNHGDYEGIDSTFAEISGPVGEPVPYIIGRLSRDDQWIVYDLDSERVLFSAKGRGNALGYWKELGLAEPVYLTPGNIKRHLSETRESIRRRWTMDLQLWLVFALLPVACVAPALWYLGRKAAQHHRDTGSWSFRLSAHVLTASSVALGLLALHSLLRVIQQNW